MREAYLASKKRMFPSVLDRAFGKMRHMLKSNGGE